METICSEDGCTKPEDREGLCFKHRIAGIRFGFVGGGGYGRKAFSSGTHKEYVDQLKAGAKKQGREIRPIPQRAELI